MTVLLHSPPEVNAMYMAKVILTLLKIYSVTAIFPKEDKFDEKPNFPTSIYPVLSYLLRKMHYTIPRFLLNHHLLYTLVPN